MTRPRYIDDAIAAGYSLLTVADVDATPLQTHDARVRVLGNRDIYPGQSVIVASPNQARFATVTAISRGDGKVTLACWADEHQPQYNTSAGTLPR
jgi:hypothetical protein